MPVSPVITSSSGARNRARPKSAIRQRSEWSCNRQINDTIEDWLKIGTVNLKFGATSEPKEKRYRPFHQIKQRRRTHQENVGWLQIAMDDRRLVRVKIGESVCYFQSCAKPQLRCALADAVLVQPSSAWQRAAEPSHAVGKRTGVLPSQPDAATWLAMTRNVPHQALSVPPGMCSATIQQWEGLSSDAHRNGRMFGCLTKGRQHTGAHHTPVRSTTQTEILCRNSL